MRNYLFKRSVLVLLITFAMLSCRPYKDIVYFQDIQDLSFAEVDVNPEQYILKKGDVLLIDIKGVDQDITSLFSKSQSSANTSANQFTNPGSVYLVGYDINTNGEVILPIVGNVKVSDQTIEAARNTVQKRVDEYFKDAVVFMKLINARFSVIGEVKRPGVYYSSSNRINVLEALSMAGDINEYGDIKKITVIRKKDNMVNTYQLDLSSAKMLSSDAYFLQPDDVIYVEPVKWRNFKLNIPTYTLILSSITTLMVVLQYFGAS